MHEQPTAPQPLPVASSPPDDESAVATLDWVMAVTDAHVMPVDRTAEPAVLAAAWALGLAGATRLQVWWVLRDQRLRHAYGSIIRALGKVRAPGPPSWTDLVVPLSAAARAELAVQAERVLAAHPTRVPHVEAALFAACRRHPQAVRSVDRRVVTVPEGAVAELAARARSLSPAEADAILDRARGPFGQRMAEAARVHGEQVATFHARRRGTRVA